MSSGGSVDTERWRRTTAGDRHDQEMVQGLLDLNREPTPQTRSLIGSAVDLVLECRSEGRTIRTFTGSQPVSHVCSTEDSG